MYIKRKRREGQMLQILSGIAGRNGSHVAMHEVFGDFIIGMDESHSHVFFYKKNQGNPLEQSINLSAIQQCKVVNSTVNIQGKNGKYQVTDRLALTFIPKDKSLAASRLEFFNAEDSMQLNGELQVAEKWAKMVHEGLKRKK